MHKATISATVRGVTTSFSKVVERVSEGVIFASTYAVQHFDHELSDWDKQGLGEHGFTRVRTTDGAGEDMEIEVNIEMDFDKERLAELLPDPKNPIYLYVLVRNDMESLVGTPEDRKAGLPCAQTGHAANQMVYQVRKKNQSDLNDLLTEWENETGMGFGTEIVVGAHYSRIKQAVETAALLGHHAAMTKDPEYPLRDGKMMHFIPVETCGYIFGRKNDLQAIMSQFDLLP